MERIKTQLIAVIEENASHRLGVLAGELVRAPSPDREVVLAEMEFQGCLVDVCRQCGD